MSQVLRFGAVLDASYTRQDGFDNATDAVVLGPVATERVWTMEYVLELPVSHRTHAGAIQVTHRAGAATVVEHSYSFDEPEIAGLSWTADIATGQARVLLTKTSVVRCALMAA